MSDGGCSPFCMPIKEMYVVKLDITVCPCQGQMRGSRILTAWGGQNDCSGSCEVFILLHGNAEANGSLLKHSLCSQSVL